MVCKNCVYFNEQRFYCMKLQCHVYLTDKCRYFQSKSNTNEKQNEGVK
ncbi:hypothetical protein [Halanaerobacter jeridensis]|uniref:Uncharacterized protein n=1 Tax=Halanaerobacter jeridensis TaxID=706427 RepID=A0A938XNL3_9FIRM|nr:hypothetical protein [Halanaerobacter jeridensis]MBM7555958.1 hypothetical protein [Halanaerobacter jeridensis]